MVFDFVPQSTLPGTVTTKGVTGPKVRPEVQEAEIQLAVCAAVHFSIVVIDHVGELMTTHGVGSPLQHMRLHRTKCQNLINNCIAKSIKDDIKDSAGGKPHVIIIDESTDISTQKHLCVAIAYLCQSGIVTDFLSLIPVTDTTAETLFQALKAKLSEFGLRLSVCLLHTVHVLFWWLTI